MTRVCLTTHSVTVQVSLRFHVSAFAWHRCPRRLVVTKCVRIGVRDFTFCLNATEDSELRSHVRICLPRFPLSRLRSLPLNDRPCLSSVSFQLLVLVKKEKKKSSRCVPLPTPSRPSACLPVGHPISTFSTFDKGKQACCINCCILCFWTLCPFFWSLRWSFLKPK